MSDYEIDFEKENNFKHPNCIRGCLENDLRWSGRGGVKRNWKNSNKIRNRRKSSEEISRENAFYKKCEPIPIKP